MNVGEQSFITIYDWPHAAKRRQVVPDNAHEQRTVIGPERAPVIANFGRNNNAGAVASDIVGESDHE